MTKAERRKIYIKAFERIGFGTFEYMCHAISGTHDSPSALFLKRELPEFYLMAPSVYLLLCREQWMPSDKKYVSLRQTILAFCIAMTE